MFRVLALGLHGPKRYLEVVEVLELNAEGQKTLCQQKVTQTGSFC